MSDQPAKHAEQHTPYGPDAIQYVVHKIKLTGDRDIDDPVAVDARAFTIPVEEDQDGLYLKRVFCGLGVASASGDVELMLRNETQAVDLLSANAGVPATAFYANSSSVIADPPDNRVFEGDILVVSIEDAGDGAAKGLTLTLVLW